MDSRHTSRLQAAAQLGPSTAVSATGEPTAAPTVLNQGQSCERSCQNQPHGSTVVQVAALQTYIMERDQIHDGLVSEFEVSVMILSPSVK